MGFAQQQRGTTAGQGGPSGAAGQRGGVGAGGSGGSSQGLGGIFRDLSDDSTNIETRITRGKGERVIIIIEGDDDSDRPAWAGGEKELNPQRGDGNPTPGTTKGDLYGDLVYLYRDPITGLPILDDDGNEQACTTIDCSEYASIIDGEIPAGAIEVDFGRTNIMRAPASVTEHSLDEVVNKLFPVDADGNPVAVTITTDEAGRIVVDGATIDSPLENYALYLALLSGTISIPGFDDPVLLATSALAGAADKTGDITLDFVINVNEISELSTGDLDYYDYTGFTYVRDYDDDADGDGTIDPYTYYYFDTDGTTVLSAQLWIDDYLALTNGDLPSSTEYAALFAQAADDALEVIELVHTQIHDSQLPGTIPQ
ncbi:MAG: hypothetical protein LPK16_06690 [Rhodobacterales bacterium]|nr:hypothetical protein [Rhodobacterales bacterium]